MQIWVKYSCRKKENNPETIKIDKERKNKKENRQVERIWI